MTERIQFDPFNRPPRIQEPFKPVEFEIPSPPASEPDRQQPWLLTLLPLSSILIMGVFYLISASGNSTTGSRGALMALPMLGIGVFVMFTSLIVSSHQKYEQKHQRIRQLREYHRQLDKKEARILAGNSLQMDWLVNNFLKPEDVLNRAQQLELNLWERRQEDLDFLAIRLGTGKIPSHINIHPPDPDINSPDIRRAFGIYTRYRNLIKAPIVANFRELRSIGVVGSRSQTMPVIYSILSQLSVYHSPEDVNLYILAPEYRYKNWEWMRWLPHTSSSMNGGHPDNMAFGQKATRAMISTLSKELDKRRDQKENENDQPVKSGPYSVVIFDGYADVLEEPGFSSLIKDGKSLRAVSIVICESMEEVPSDCEAVIQVKQRTFKYARTGEEGVSFIGMPDTQTLVNVDNLARKLLPVNARTLGQTSRIPSIVPFLEMHRVEKVEDINIDTNWKRLPVNGILPFPVTIGNESLNQELSINLAENHDGPHGMIAGTTGSGKSELLQTLVEALALGHHPYFVNFLLIDFKGESTFGVFRNLPHTVGLVSNLDKMGAIRTLEAIRAENIRRQQLLKSLEIEDITDYHKEISRREMIPNGWEPLPHLFIIVDEFAQLAKDLPNFLGELVAIGQVGRSLGVHLVLATQRPAGVVTDQMRANINFRISLRVQTMDDSRDMLRRPDAAFLPPHLPGRAYFQLGDGGTARQFQCAWVGGEYSPAKNDSESVNDDPFIYLLQNEQKIILSQPSKKSKDNPENKPRLVNEALVKRMEDEYQKLVDKGSSKKLPKILLDALPGELPLADLLKNDDAKNSVSWNNNIHTWNEVSEDNYLIPIGMIDDLANRRQPSLTINFGRTGGHILIAGASGMGKTIFLRSMILSAVQCLPPSLLNIYIISFAGKSLERLKELPHVGDVIFSGENERLNRFLRYLQEKLEERKNLLASKKKDDWYSYNQSVSCDEQVPLIVVAIDNFAELRDASYEAELDDLEKIIRDARAYGIYFVITVLQSNALPLKIMNLIDQRLVLYMTDKSECPSIIGKGGLAELDSIPGRGIINSTPPLLFQIAVPLDIKEAERIGDYEGHIISSLCQNNCKFLAPQRIDVLPKQVNLSQLLDEYADKVKGTPGHMPVLMGIEGTWLKPLWLDIAGDSTSFIVCGPTRSGRTSLLHSLVISSAYIYPPDELMMVLVDGSQGSLKTLSDLPHVIDWVTDDIGLRFNVSSLQNELSFRKGNHGNGRFPHILFVIDDYDYTREAFENIQGVLDQLTRNIRHDSKYGFGIWLAGIPQNLSGGSDPLVRQMRLFRSGIGLSIGDAVDAVGGRTTPAMYREILREGRGYVVNRGITGLSQFAYPDEISIDAVKGKWGHKSKNQWDNPANRDQIISTNVQTVSSDTYETSDGNWFDIDKDLVDEYLKLKAQDQNKGDDDGNS